MFVVMLFLLGLAFGYATRLPWALFAFLVPLALAAAASDRSAGAIVVGLIVTALGLLAGLALATRSERPTANG